MTTNHPTSQPSTSMPADAYGAVELGGSNPPSHTAGAVNSSAASAAPASSPAGAPTLHGPIIRDAGQADLAQIVEISQQVPVLLDLWATWCQPCKQLTPILEEVVRAQHGRIVLAKIDVDENPQIAQSLQAQSVPTVVAIIAGQPLPLFQGAQPRAQVEAIVSELLQVAANNGLVGVMVESDENSEPQIDPLHAPALDAEEAGDFEQAAQLWEGVLAKQPRDQEAKEHLARCQLLVRLGSAEEAGADDAATDPFTAADRLIASGQTHQAFEVLLDAYQAAKNDEDKGEPIRARIVELFTLVGAADPAVKAARARLSSLVF